MSEIDRFKQKILTASRILYAPNGITDVQEGFPDTSPVDYQVETATSLRGMSTSKADPPSGR